MERLEPIPSPPGHLIREFCHRFLPIGVFAIAVCLTAFLWNRRFTGTTTFGEVEPVRTTVVSAEGGTITELLVDRFQTVTNGQVIAVVQLQDPEQVRNDLEILRSELLLMKARTSLDETRNANNLESLRAQSLETRLDLAKNKALSAFADRENERIEPLFKEKVVSDSLFDTARTTRDVLRIDIGERTALLTALNEAVDRLEQTQRKDTEGNFSAIEKSLQAQEAKYNRQQEYKIRATMDGVIRSLGHRVGEHIAAGTALAEITATRSERIIGYIRQPLILEPRPGMPVEIRTRGPERQTATSKVLSVGVDLELVVSPLRLRGFDNSTERGLAFAVELPPSLKVHPGELVDLIVHPLAE